MWMLLAVQDYSDMMEIDTKSNLIIHPIATQLIIINIMRIKVLFYQVALTITLGWSIAFVIYACSKNSSYTTPPNTTSLSAALDSADWYLINTTEGAQPGEYPVGSKASLRTALDSAQTILHSASTMLQWQVDRATANLNTAISTYASGKIGLFGGGSELVAYWKFNGNANDSSGYGHNGILEAGPAGLAAIPGPAPSLTTDRFGNANSAYHFSGGGNIDVPFSYAFNYTAITVSLWCRQDTAGRTDHPNDCYMISLSRWNGWKFQTQTARPFFTVATHYSIYDRDAGTAITIGTATGAGPWTHLVISYDGNNVEKFYINGVLVKTWTDLQGAILQIIPAYDLSIGSDLPNSAYSTSSTDPNYIGKGGYWTGDLDDVMIFKSALSDTLVSQIYNQQKSK
jgi:hypothetical protein